MTSPKVINIVSRDNGIGLTTDMQLITEWLGALGHDVQRVDYRERMMRRAHAAIFCELFTPHLAYYTRHIVGVFNLEWLPHHWRRHLPRFSQLWARSREAHQTFQQWRLKQSHLTGFLGSDLYDPGVRRQMTCLHLRGASTLKGTETVLAAWAQHTDLPPLTVISHKPLDSVPAGVRVLGRVDEAELARLMNENVIHLCPSRSEGWGHYIVEALSVGSLVVTTDASPMHEHVQPGWGYLLPATPGPLHHQAMEHHTQPDDLAAAVRHAAALPPAAVERMGARARQHFAARNDAFRLAAGNLLTRLWT